MFSDISSRVQENLSGVRMVRAFVQERAELRRFEELNRQYIAQNLKLVRIQAIFQPLLEVLIGADFPGGAVGGRARRCCAGRISIGSFIMFNTYMGMLVWPMIALGWVVNLMQRGSASLEPHQPDYARDGRPFAAPREPVPLSTRARAKSNFAASPWITAAGAALAAIDLRIPAGATVAVVGHTGRGKSTLVGLVPRLIDPTGGRGAAGRRSICATWIPAELRRQIGFVPQETFLFSATLAENIAFGVEARDRRARSAARPRSRGWPATSKAFPTGYETMVGERGITLSGGQKQRTAIARAILRDPRILILDDALSSVDTLTEERILTHLAGVMRGRTVILISHRVSTVRQAGSHRGAGERPHRGAGHARRAGRGRRLLRRPVAEADARRGAGSHLRGGGSA